MAVSNRERVGRAFEVLATGLAPFVDRQMTSVHGEGWLEGFVDSGPRNAPHRRRFAIRRCCLR